MVHCNSGLVFGDAVLSLRLLDIPPMEGKLQGVKMEIDDCAFRHVLGDYHINKSIGPVFTLPTLQTLYALPILALHSIE